MKLNLFAIPSSDVDPLRARLSDAGMAVIKDVEQSGWHGDFYLSGDPHPSTIPWVETFAPYFEDLDEVPAN